MNSQELIKATSKRQSALGTLLEQMDIPEFRRDTTKITNVRWLARNLAIQNGKHPMFKTSMGLIRWLLKEGWIDTSHIGA